MNYDKKLSEAPPLLPRQKKYVQDNYNRMTIGEMAANIKADKLSILNYCDEQDFPLRRVYSTRAAIKEKRKKQMFEHSKDWI